MLLLAHPDASDEALEGVLAKVGQAVEGLGGELLDVEHWGRRKLAYPVRRCPRGYYLVVRFLGEPQTVRELEGVLRYDEWVLRHQIVRLDKGELRTLLAAVERKRQEQEGEEGGDRTDEAQEAQGM